MKSKINLSLPIYDVAGKKTQRTISLSSSIFKEKINSDLIAQYIRVYLYNKRSWNASTKTRGEIKASKRKIYRQKGTGRARHGNISAPIFVGGGITFGPRPKNKKLDINKNQKRKALFGTLTQALNDEKIIILSDSSLKISIKTSKIVEFLKKMKIYQKKTLFVYPKNNSQNLYLSSRNINNLDLCLPLNINAYKILNANKIIFVESALQIFQNHYIKNEN
jgi:large subunit ribosomal protein L4